MALKEHFIIATLLLWVLIWAPTVEASVECQSSSSYCPNGSSCCRVSDGWMCCPYSDGICCGSYCCASGNVCTSGGCTAFDDVSGSEEFLQPSQIRPPIDLLEPTTTISQETFKDDFEVGAAALQGILIGLKSDVSIQEIVNCVDDFNGIVSGIEDAFKHFREGDMGTGVDRLAQALTGIPTALTVCKGSESEVKQLVQETEEALEIFRHPRTLIYRIGHNLVVNGVDIYKEISAGVDAWKIDEYQESGFNIGSALKLLLQAD
eukprot:CAMPEP_0114996282 /NCGR_PEP_ID=MMETSP0216-20121206/14217_1 /TAXON_ID=223996 /ORGANISM="Protocruzia adherens, Strain Boccale" /LENGTH=262 /DNA_ID=CAMNT_0002360455 /DNA_START=249 /DNA_END=1037 /DNA_ORIENTATION=+